MGERSEAWKWGEGSDASSWVGGCLRRRICFCFFCFSNMDCLFSNQEESDNDKQKQDRLNPRRIQIESEMNPRRIQDASNMNESMTKPRWIQFISNVNPKRRIGYGEGSES